MRVLFDTADATAVCNVMCVVFEEATLMKLEPPSKDILSSNVNIGCVAGDVIKLLAAICLNGIVKDPTDATLVEIPEFALVEDKF